MLFTERNNLRKEKEYTYDIGPDMYCLILDLCSEFFINLAYKYPLYCHDDETSIYKYSKTELIRDLKFEIPSLIKDDDFYRPKVRHNAFNGDEVDEYDQFAVLDLAEYVYDNIKDYEQGYYHKFFSHYHLNFIRTRHSKREFIYKLNKLFEKLGLLYIMRDGGEIERVVSNSSTLQELKDTANNSKDNSFKELVNQAITFYLKPSSSNIQIALEKIWDAFERIKTIYPDLDKKKSTNKLLDDVSLGDENFRTLLNDEFIGLTTIGNNYRIRHHEANKIEIVDDRHKEYLFNRCASLILICLRYIEKID